MTLSTEKGALHYMGKLYRYGYEKGLRGTGWQTTPPGYGAASGASGT